MSVIRNGARRRDRTAFTLIELLIVIAILLALFGIVAGTFLAVGERADVDIQKVQLETIEDALQRFRLHVKRYPTEEEGLAALWDKTVLETEEDEAKWQGPYLEEKVTKDKWGHELLYYNPSQDEGRPYDLISMGPDGEEGTEDDIASHTGGESAEETSDFTFDE